jgi:hypothetical protein
MGVGWSLSAAPPMPEYRVDEKGFNCGARDIKAVCDSAGRELWKHFPDYKVERFVVQYGKDGPIVYFKRNAKKEIVMRLNTGNLLWSQFAYQFAHEFCHILCGFDQDNSRHEWFEETLCEMASLYCMRAMAKSWKNDPPYKHWAGYRDSLRDYVDDVTARRAGLVLELNSLGMKGFHEKHKKRLNETKTDRDLNGVMAWGMLPLFEEKPERWEAVRWLNATPGAKNDTFEDYLQKWHAAAPKRHKETIKTIAGMYGFSLK